MKKLFILVFVLIVISMNADNIPFSQNPYSAFEENGHTWSVLANTTQWSGSSLSFMTN